MSNSMVSIWTIESKAVENVDMKYIDNNSEKKTHNIVVLLTTAYHMSRINFNSSLVATFPHPASTILLTKLHVTNKCYRMTYYLIIDLIESMDRSSAAAAFFSFSLLLHSLFAFNFNHNPFIISAWSDSIVYRTYIAIRLNIMANRHFQ